MKTFILGASDGEMLLIDDLLSRHGQTVLYAADRNGGRVGPKTAYEAVGLLRVDGVGAQSIADTVTKAVVVECDFPGLTPGIRCDHHRPGDPGYGKPPNEYWRGSSLGQVCEILGITPTPEMKMMAASDHCPAAAYKGQCQGVDPAEFAEFRIEQLCCPSQASNRSQTRTPQGVRDSIQAAKLAIQSAFWPKCHMDSEPYGINLGGIVVADLRGEHIPDLPEAAMIFGIAYLAGGISLRNGESPKIVLGGCGEGTVPGTAPIEVFLDGWAAELGLTGLYGDPVRGFAGGYLPQD